MTSIPKVAGRTDGLTRRFSYFDAARSAFRAYLERARLGSRDRVLLPAYIGWSPREGSGVFDPVESLSLAAGFYRLDRSLRIDLEDLEARLREGRTRVVVLIHYFGYVDPGYETAVSLARNFGAQVLEDEAHAMLTDLVAARSGRLGDAAIFSLHKLLPVKIGGLLVEPRESAFPGVGVRAAGAHAPGYPPELPDGPWTFDLARMAEARRRNAALLHRLLAPLAGRVDPLWPDDPRIVPQTLPVRIRRASRDALYERMNAAGFGVVSLYHTLIEPLRRGPYPASQELARTLMNLPVHQEATEPALVAMIAELDRQTASLEREA